MDMEIRLIRHGKPQFWSRYEPYTLLKGSRVGSVLMDYNNSGVMRSSRPPASSVVSAQGAAVAYCSGLRRTIETASTLGVRCKLMEDPVFLEPEIPHGFWKGVRLPLAAWFMISQLLWHLGYSRNCEPIKRARARADKAARLLINAAKAHGTVLVVGHSMMNGMIFDMLKRYGWTPAQKEYDGRFWGCNTLRPWRDTQ